MTIAFVQFQVQSTGAYVNISPTAGNALFIQSLISSAYGGSPTSFQLMSAANGGGSVLANFTIPSALANTNYPTPNFQLVGAYLLNVPAGGASVLGTWSAGTPGTLFLPTVEMSGVDGSAGFVAAKQNGLHAPGSSTDAITSGSVSAGSTSGYVLGFATDFDGRQTFVAGTGYTALASASTFTLVEGKSVSGSGSYAATYTDATHGSTDDYGVTTFVLAPVAALAASQAMSTYTGASLATRF